MCERMKKVFLIVLAVGLIIASALISHISLVIAVEPFGATVNPLTSERAPEDPAQGIDAVAGNVTELNIFGYTITQSWQGYYGNVTGAVMLADSSDNVMYNWSVSSPSGEIYASTNDSINWRYIQCFNFTASGTYANDLPYAGQTSQFGTNMTILEGMYGIQTDDVDGVNETFDLFAGGHNAFYTSNFEFSEGECRSTRIFSQGGNKVEDQFEEVLLYEPTSYSVIFASLLNKDVIGFDNNPRDFQMLVLEDGHGTDESPTNYYFYVELE
jgi:hypothetical protein